MCTKTCKCIWTLGRFKVCTLVVLKFRLLLPLHRYIGYREQRLGIHALEFTLSFSRSKKKDQNILSLSMSFPLVIYTEIINVKTSLLNTSYPDSLSQKVFLLGFNSTVSSTISFTPNYALTARILTL